MIGKKRIFEGDKMNIALIIAGGKGTRMGQPVPKQYHTVNDKPLLMYTAENAFKAGCFDELYVACADGWRDFVESYVNQYKIEIFRGTFPAGTTRLGTCAEAVSRLKNTVSADSTISIIDANRPMTPKQLFLDGIEALKDADSSLPLDACYDSMYVVERGSGRVMGAADRDILFKGQTPETARFGAIAEVFERAAAEKVEDSPLTALMIRYGKRVAYTKGSPRNFKITTADDIELFKAILGQM